MSKNETIVCDVCGDKKATVTVREDTIDLCDKCFKMLSIISFETIHQPEEAHAA